MAICGSLYSQVKVLPNGNVHIGTTNSTPSFYGGLIIEPMLGCTTIYNPPLPPYSTCGPACDLYGYGKFTIGKTANKVNTIWVGYINTYDASLLSDIRLKENIKPCPSFLSALKNVRSYNYNYTDEFFRSFIPEEEMIGRVPKMEYGFIAQELQEIFPELVRECDSAGMLVINYISMIPILTSAINELQQEIETLKEKLATFQNPIQPSPKGGDAGKSAQEFILTDSDIEEMKVFQNAPNPFNERTTIQCYIPQTVRKAELCVYNMQGLQVKCLSVTERGAVDIQIQAGQLSAGVYTYFLIGDGRTCEAKQMILTK